MASIPQPVMRTKDLYAVDEIIIWFQRYDRTANMLQRELVGPGRTVVKEDLSKSLLTYIRQMSPLLRLTMDEIISKDKAHKRMLIKIFFGGFALALLRATLNRVISASVVTATTTSHNSLPRARIIHLAGYFCGFTGCLGLYYYFDWQTRIRVEEALRIQKQLEENRQFCEGLLSEGTTREESNAPTLLEGRGLYRLLPWEGPLRAVWDWWKAMEEEDAGRLM